jgi:hypothetical protein
MIALMLLLPPKMLLSRLDSGAEMGFAAVHD